MKNGCLGYEISDRKGNTSFKQMCNFVPYISSQVLWDDGYEKNTNVVIAGFDMHGRPLPPVTVSNDEFDKMMWVRKNWGYECNISPGQNIKDHIRFAVQSTTAYAQKQFQFRTTGWKKIKDKWYFLMPGNTETDVCLEGKMKNYRFSNREVSSDEMKDIFRLNEALAPCTTMQVLNAFSFLSPLNSFLRMAQHEPKTVLLLYGKTGSKKSTVAALISSFFGQFSTTDLPLSFRDTANSLLHNTSVLKDVLTVIDDFHPSSKKDESSMNDTMQMLLRAYGNRSGRSRLNSKAEPTKVRYPKGNAIITAEFLPDAGESGTARYIPLELHENDVDNDSLTYYQRLASDGVLSSCMRKYTEWIRTKYLGDNEQIFVSFLADKFIEYRKNIFIILAEEGIKIRDRLTDDLVALYIGFTFMTEFFVDEKVIDKDTKYRFDKDFIKVLITTATSKTEQLINDQPAHKFICKLYAMTESGRLTLIKKDSFLNGENLPFNMVGYEDENNLYLLKSVAHKEVKRFCEEQGEAFTITEKGLLKALEAENILTPSPDGKHTVQHNFDGHQKRYLVIPKNKAEAIYNENE